MQYIVKSLEVEISSWKWQSHLLRLHSKRHVVNDKWHCTKFN